MEEMWLARDANNDLYLFIDEVPPKKERGIVMTREEEVMENNN